MRGRALTRCGEHLVRITSEVRLLHPVQDADHRRAEGIPICADACRSCRGAIGLCSALAPRRLPSAGRFSHARSAARSLPGGELGDKSGRQGRAAGLLNKCPRLYPGRADN